LDTVTGAPPRPIESRSVGGKSERSSKKYRNGRKSFSHGGAARIRKGSPGRPGKKHGSQGPCNTSRTGLLIGVKRIQSVLLRGKTMRAGKKAPHPQKNAILPWRERPTIPGGPPTGKNNSLERSHRGVPCSKKTPFYTSRKTKKHSGGVLVPKKKKEAPRMGRNSGPPD